MSGKSRHAMIDLPGGREGKQKLDEEYFGGERIPHVGRIPRVRALGLRRILGFAVLYLPVSYEVPIY